VTAPYSVAFYADKDDLIDGHPPAQIAYAALRETGGDEYERVREAIKRLIAAARTAKTAMNRIWLAARAAAGRGGTCTGSVTTARSRQR
jgi:hypothetical protein